MIDRVRMLQRLAEDALCNQKQFGELSRLTCARMGLLISTSTTDCASCCTNMLRAATADIVTVGTCAAAALLRASCCSSAAPTDMADVPSARVQLFEFEHLNHHTARL